MTVKELIEELEDLQDDKEVKVVKNGREYDTAIEIASVGYYDNDAEWVQIEMSEVSHRIGGGQ